VYANKTKFEVRKMLTVNRFIYVILSKKCCYRRLMYMNIISQQVLVGKHGLLVLAPNTTGFRRRE
jgi:hypothetical protein